jgi:hypothetical protein
MRAAILGFVLCLAAPAAAQQADTLPPAPDKMDRQAPILQLSWRRFNIGRAGDAMPGDNSAMDGVMFEWYPISSYLRFGLGTEYAREHSDRSEHDWYLAEHLSLGLQKPGPITPFIEGSVGAGYFKRYVVSQEQPTAIWEFGADAGALFHFSGSGFVSLSAGWVHPVWLLVSVDQMSLTQVYRDSFAFKLGLGF